MTNLHLRVNEGKVPTLYISFIKKNENGLLHKITEVLKFNV